MRKRLAAGAALLIATAGCTSPAPVAPSTSPPRPSPAASAVAVREPTLIYFADLPRLRQAPFIGEVTTAAQLAELDVEPEHVADKLRAAVRQHQAPGVRLFAYTVVTGCADDSATLVIQPPRLTPRLLPEAESNCTVPDFYAFAFAVPASLVPRDVDIGCQPGPITCPRAA